MKEVFKKYTEEEIFDFVPYDDVLFQGTLQLHEDETLKQEIDFAESNKVDFSDINEIKKVIREQYLGDFKYVRHFTIETNALKNNIDEIYFCEVFKGGRGLLMVKVGSKIVVSREYLSLH